MVDQDHGLESHQPVPVERRCFCKKTLALIFGAVAGLVPAGAGLTVFLDPLRRKSESAALVRVSSLAALPADGSPRKFSVVADQTDAWNKYPNTPVGAVYLRRTGDKTVEALNVVCPHAGCFVDFDAGRREFICPCHRSSFTVDGQVKDPRSPSPRGMDTLAVEIRNQTEIWVQFRNYLAGQKEKIPVA